MTPTENAFLDFRGMMYRLLNVLLLLMNLDNRTQEPYEVIHLAKSFTKIRKVANVVSF